MGIALLSLRQAEKVEPELKAAIRSVPQAQSALAKSSLAQAAQARTEAAMAAVARPKTLAEAGLSARERLALREGPAEAVAAALNARQ